MNRDSGHLGAGVEGTKAGAGGVEGWPRVELKTPPRDPAAHLKGGGGSRACRNRHAGSRGPSSHMLTSQGHTMRHYRGTRGKGPRQPLAGHLEPQSVLSSTGGRGPAATG
jgi:hypothetical protein